MLSIIMLMLRKVSVEIRMGTSRKICYLAISTTSGNSSASFLLFTSFLGEMNILDGRFPSAAPE
jgi:hypothetical protein